MVMIVLATARKILIGTPVQRAKPSCRRFVLKIGKFEMSKSGRKRHFLKKSIDNCSEILYQVSRI